MHWACHRGPLELALNLIQNGGSIECKNNNGETPLALCDLGTVKLNRTEILAEFFGPAQNWTRRKAFVGFLTAVYGSAVYQAKEQKQPIDERKERNVIVQTSTPQMWRVVDKVLCVRELSHLITAYL
jgi:hypothetical protein